MCGISGILSLSGRPVDFGDVARLNARIAHRGPDGEGIWVSPDQKCVLGHRRLAIIDTDMRSNQPMLTPDARYAIVFNGEIYNFLEVRAELLAKGHQFRTESDTEVVLAAWREWGSDMQLRFNGMWAMAIYDCAEARLFLARDRFAEKPLFYVERDGMFAFASEMRALADLPWVPKDLDLQVIARGCFDTHTIEASEATLFSHIRRLPAAHTLTLDAQRRQMQRWWRTTDHLQEFKGGIEDAADEFWERFREAVKICMRSDVPIGSCLSGGFDSSAIVATMAHLDNGSTTLNTRQSQDWRHAFVASFPGMTNDETPEAMIAAHYAGITSPNFIDVSKQEPITALEKSMSALEGIGLAVPNATWHTYEAVRRSGVVVSIDGHGADEMMGGYRQVNQGFKFWVRTLFGNAAGRSAGFNFLSDHLKLRVLHAQGNVFLRNKLSPPPLLDIAAYHDDVPDHWGAFDRRLYGMFHATILPTLMRNFDRLSMAHSVEVRSPFLDWRLVTFAFSLPESMKSDQNYSKLIARLAMRGRMPEEIRASKVKKGFASPMLEWLNGSLGGWAAHLMSSQNPAFNEIVDQKQLRDKINGLNVSRGWTWDNSARIWPYVHAKWFCDQYA
jgi:asparagine synthase (glutamine-hydrolysing)